MLGTDDSSVCCCQPCLTGVWCSVHVWTRGRPGFYSKILISCPLGFVSLGFCPGSGADPAPCLHILRQLPDLRHNNCTQTLFSQLFCTIRAFGGSVSSGIKDYIKAAPGADTQWPCNPQAPLSTANCSSHDGTDATLTGGCGKYNHCLGKSNSTQAFMLL